MSTNFHYLGIKKTIYKHTIEINIMWWLAYNYLLAVRSCIVRS